MILEIQVAGIFSIIAWRSDIGSHSDLAALLYLQVYTFLYRQFLYTTVVVLLIYNELKHALLMLVVLIIYSFIRYTIYAETLQMTTIHLLYSCTNSAST